MCVCCDVPPGAFSHVMKMMIYTLFSSFCCFWCVCVCVRESVCVCVCVCVRERVCVCACVL